MAAPRQPCFSRVGFGGLGSVDGLPLTRVPTASGGGGTGGPRAGAAAGAGADAGGAALLRHPGLAAGGGRAQHGPAHQGGCRSAHLQHHGCHHQQDHRAGHGQGGRPRRLRQQEMLRDGQSPAAQPVLRGPGGTPGPPGTSRSRQGPAGPRPPPPCPPPIPAAGSNK
ncbi:hypothetical protein DV515_00019058, partial [Chloebia gouldiae]